MEIKQLNLDDLIENETSSDSDDSEEEEDEKPNEKIQEKETIETQEKTKVKDSFFLGGEGSDNTSEEESENDQDITEFSSDNAMNKKRNDFMGNSKFDKNREFDRSRGRGRGQFSENRRGRGDFNRGRGERGRGNSNRGRSDFNRSRGESNRGRGDFKRGRGDFSRGRGDFDRGRGDFSRDRGDFNRDYDRENSNEKIHPSWAAKRNQQKVVIPTHNQNGSNKKIKFDDAGDTNFNTSNKFTSKIESNNSEPKNMHPSWAAKKKANPGIQQFEGKKVVFGDD